MTSGYGFAAVTGALQIFGPQDQRNRKRFARVEDATNERGCVGVDKKVDRRQVRGSRISVGHHLRPGVSVIRPGTEPLTEGKSLLFLPAAEAVDVLPVFLFKYREPRLFSPFANIF